ncbi:hypothetical protein BC937DRAFT_87052 [Endogone sp. FLAS-F59071]|nr:hypothetical protein BC937DRAFT_87052 [Endogone sp. FLAS-F59071]|eukprot:RUS19717.1 hypothetical protein BC937DRAFT_87052 [Endogone sp. FLAS-F59071]
MQKPKIPTVSPGRSRAQEVTSETWKEIGQRRLDAGKELTDCASCTRATRASVRPYSGHPVPCEPAPVPQAFALCSNPQLHPRFLCLHLTLPRPQPSRLTSRVPSNLSSPLGYLDF